MNILSLVEILKNDFDKHEKVAPPLTDEQIAEYEQKTHFTLPPSFRIFLKNFGSGADWLYMSQPMDFMDNPYWLHSFRKNLPDMIEVDQGEKVPLSSLLCLMTEDSNGGAWCWLTTYQKPDGECPLAYWDLISEKLYCQVENFTKWLELLVTEKEEVIRALGGEELLGLG